MGRGLALRWAINHDLLIGSRFSEKAREIAKKLEKIARGFYQDEMQGSISGVLNSDAVKRSEAVIITLPPEATIPVMTELGADFHPKQIVVSTVVSMKKREGLFWYTPLSLKGSVRDDGKSAAELIQEIVRQALVVSAFQTVPAAYLSNLDAILNIDVFIASNDDSAINAVSKLICDIPNLRPLKVGPLANSRWIESVTPLLLNAAVLNNLQDPSIRVVPWIPTSYDSCVSHDSRMR